MGFGITLDLIPELSTATVISTNEPICPTAGWLDWVCNVQKRIITELEIGPNGNHFQWYFNRNHRHYVKIKN